MALIDCKECSAKVSTKAKKCPQCGAPIKKKTSLLTWIVVILIGLAVIGNMTKPETSKQSGNPVNNGPTVKEWQYSVSKDDMSGKDSYFATITSTNTINFGFPYQGIQHSTLTLRSHPRYGKDILFRIEKGQFLCRASDGCTVLVKFDKAEPVKFSAAEPEDHSNTTLFISNYSGFVEKMLKAKKVLIQAQFYQEGNQTLEFDVSNFDIQKYKPSQK